MYWLYFCILCNKNGIKGLWRHKCQPSLVLGPPLVLQWTLPRPYNIPNLALLDSEKSAWWGLGWIELKQGSKYKGPCQVYCRALAGSIEGPRRVLDPMGVYLCVPRVPYLLHRMQKYSQYIKGHVGCIVWPWQGPLKDQGRSCTQWGCE